MTTDYRLQQNSSKRHSLQAVELSQRTQAAVHIVSNLPAPAMGARFTVFLCMPAMRTHWMAWRCCSHKRVMSRPIQVRQLLNKQVCICDICHKQIHVRKQISIRCNRIEHWVHLRCASIHQAQYTDTWTCYLHR